MIPRYSPQDVAELFSDEHRFDTMLEVELLAAEGLAEQGVVPHVDVVKLRQRRPVIDEDFVTAVEEREAVTNHDTAAFVDVVQSRIGMPEGAWIHYGLTSSDVVDTALCSNLTQAMDIVVTEAIALRDALTRRAVQSIDLPITGRTHGQHAEPTTYGAKFALFALQVQRDVERAQHARTSIAVGKLSGAVGTFSNIDPAVEAYVCARLGLTPVPATQVIARDRHAEVLYACASLGTAIEQFALEVRHLARSEVGEAEEPFTAGQKGSSSMPHKRNPVLSERLCGLARVLRGYLQAGLEDVALWHERDISTRVSSASSCPTPCSSRCTCCARPPGSPTAWCCTRSGPSRTSRPARSGSSSPSRSCCTGRSGMSRDDAYRVVQSAARRASDERRNFRDVIERTTT